MPREKWFCPWHHCVECGKTAVSYCIHCPNAYCKTHNTVLKKHDELGTICDEHKDDLADLILFYKASGGIQHLVTSPNVAMTVNKKPLVPLEKRPEFLRHEKKVQEERAKEREKRVLEREQNDKDDEWREYESRGKRKSVGKETEVAPEDKENTGKERSPAVQNSLNNLSNSQGKKVVKRLPNNIPFGQRSPFQVSQVF